MIKSWFLGAAAVMGAHALWLLLLVLQARFDLFMAAVMALQFVVPNAAGVGAFLTTLSAPRHGFPLGLSMAPLGALAASASNLLMSPAGVHLDFAGGRGSFGQFAISLAYGLVVSAAGAGLGLWLAGQRKDSGLAPPAGHI